MILSTIIIKKEQAINLQKKYFRSYGSFYNNKQTNKKKKQAKNLLHFHCFDTIYKNKQKGRSNKFAADIL